MYGDGMGRPDKSVDHWISVIAPESLLILTRQTLVMTENHTPNENP